MVLRHQPLFGVAEIGNYARHCRAAAEQPPSSRRNLVRMSALHPTEPFRIGSLSAGSCRKRPSAKPAMQQRGCTRRRWISHPEDASMSRSSIPAHIPLLPRDGIRLERCGCSLGTSDKAADPGSPELPRRWSITTPRSWFFPNIAAVRRPRGFVEPCMRSVIGTQPLFSRRPAATVCW